MGLGLDLFGGKNDWVISRETFFGCVEEDVVYLLK